MLIFCIQPRNYLYFQNWYQKSRCHRHGGVGGAKTTKNRQFLNFLLNILHYCHIKALQVSLELVNPSYKIILKSNRQNMHWNRRKSPIFIKINDQERIKTFYIWSRELIFGMQLNNNLYLWKEKKIGGYPRHGGVACAKTTKNGIFWHFCLISFRILT